jgi:uncharacterized protein with ATP-grasp and redox domains
MKLNEECYECLQRLVRQAAEMATDDENLRDKAVERGLKTLDEHFSLGKVSIVVATRLHDIVKQITGNPDPYREMKDREITVARELYHEIEHRYGDGFHDLVKLAIVGNNLDFFKPLDDIKRDMRREVKFVIDDSARFEAKLRNANKVLYLADNAGEVFFDLPLVRWMRKSIHVTYVVKAAPVQNDITIEDIERMKLDVEVGDSVTTGTATPGIDFSQASDEFVHEYETADLIFAKGMGYYESLSEFPAEGKVFHCLVAKCGPVARSLDVPENSFVAMLR